MKDHLKKAISEQLALNHQSNLLYCDVKQAFEVDDGFLSMLKNLKQKRDLDFSETRINELIDFAVQKLIEKVYDINQFIHISNEKQQEATSIYRDTLEAMVATDDIETVLYDFHYPRLSLWLYDLYPSHFVDVLKDIPTLGKVVCEEYSPEFQCKILGLDPKQLMQPVMDIGCGKNGNLVRFLLKSRIRACGIDRIAVMNEPVISRQDWFDLDMNESEWGTIISNIALSNHIIYVSKNDPSLFQKYKKMLKRLVNSLKPGGTFIYAPGTPVIEGEIDRFEFSVINRPISETFYTTTIRRHTAG